MTDEQEKNPKIVVDSDWKEQVQAEKDAARQAADQEPEQQAETGEESLGELPPASFPLLVSSLATQALMLMGQIPDAEGNPIFQLDHAKHTIDMLAVLEEKTKGNLDAKEDAMIQQVLHELRMAFVAVSQSPASPADLVPPGDS